MSTGDQRGGATVLVVAVLGVLLLLGAALGVAGAMIAAHRRAQAAADLAALGAARVLQTGGDACGQAAVLAGANGAVLTTCTVEGADVRVEVTAEGPHWLGQTADLAAESRAGPAP
ncbi:MAG TPA: Rv3654c family TadE-like protein [Nocardioides sp.]|nr:Rv3654c family TadE-like protein [Nocardioides sp.]